MWKEYYYFIFFVPKHRSDHNRDRGQTVLVAPRLGKKKGRAPMLLCVEFVLIPTELKMTHRGVRERAGHGVPVVFSIRAIIQNATFKIDWFD